MVVLANTAFKSQILYTKLSYPVKGPLNFTIINEKADAVYNYVTSDENSLYFMTNKNAPNYRFIRIDLDHPQQEKWVNILPENQTKVLKSVVAVNRDYLGVVYMKDVIDYIEIYGLKDGKHIKTLNTTIGTIETIDAKRQDSELFFKVVSFLSPGTVYRYDFKGNELKV